MSALRVPSLKLLQGFEAAARHGNFSRAADELCLSQSAISHQVQQLEQHVGQPLFRRVGRGVELTVAGEVLQRSVQRAIESLQGGLGQIASYLDPGLVVLVCPAALAQGWLQARLPALYAALPQLSLLLSCDESARFVDEIDVDIVIADRPLQQAGVMETPFLADEWLLVAGAELAQRLAPLAAETHHLHSGLICLEQSFSHEDTAGWFRQSLAPFRRVGIFDDERLLLDAALRNVGVACLPRLLAAEALADGRLQPLAGYPRVAGSRYCLCRVDGEPRAAIVRQVYDWLQAEADAWRQP